MCSEEVPCWQTQAQRSSSRALASSRLTEMVPSFPPQACRLSCHLCCSTSLTPPTIQPHKDVLLGAEQKGTWLDLYPWPPASGKPCSPYRSVTRNVNEQLPDQCGLPTPPPLMPDHAWGQSNSHSNNGGCLSLSQADRCLRSLDVYCTRHSTGQFIRNAISHTEEKRTCL